MEPLFQVLLLGLLLLSDIRHDEGLPANQGERTSLETWDLLGDWIAGAGTYCDFHIRGLAFSMVSGGKKGLGEPDVLCQAWLIVIQLCWAFSIVLESVCVLPQLLLLRQTTVPTVIDSYYLLTLGSYRAFYILNWIVRRATEGSWDPIPLLFGIIQTAFYADFAWVYYSRQRVKLRNGGVVDSEDFSKSWLVNRVVNFRARRTSSDEEQHLREGGQEADGRPSSNRWGARGISIAADDTLEQQGLRHNDHDDDGFEGVLDDEDHEAGTRFAH